MTVPITRRLVALEEKLLVKRGVAGICTPRGGPMTLAEAASFERRVTELHEAGYSVVYVAHLAGRLPASELLQHTEPMP